MVLREEESVCSSSRSFSLERKEGLILGSETGQWNLADLFECGHFSGDPICNGLFGKSGIAVRILSSSADDGITLCKKSANGPDASPMEVDVLYALRILEVNSRPT